jgi:hypothetical protein
VAAVTLDAEEVAEVTERKPREMPIVSWVDRQIAEAQERGEFEDLRGSGRPLAPPSGRDAATDWAIRKAKEGDLEVASFLPPSLKLMRELEDLPQTLARVRTEQRVRAIVEDINERIRETHRRPQVGPPLRARPLDVDKTVEEWRASRP